MNRRGFLSVLSAVSATAVLDPERLLWVPGAKTISIPPIKHCVGDLKCLSGEWAVFNGIKYIYMFHPPFHPVVDIPAV